jgi:uncharacterized membrane protein (UPF0127 family)
VIIGGIVFLLDDGARDRSPADEVATTGGPLGSHPPDGPPTTSSSTTATTTAANEIPGADLGAVAPAGFGLTAARVTVADGTVCDVCLWVADSVQLRKRGLMGVTELAPADGMAFVYPEPHTTRFWMKDTLMPLSIAFYGPGGEFIDSFDMEPCVTNDCLRYPTPSDFLIAVETYQSGLGAIGMLAGSTLELLDLPCRLGVVPGA